MFLSILLCLADGGLFCFSSSGIESTERRLDVDMPVAEEFAIAGCRLSVNGFHGIVQTYNDCEVFPLVRYAVQTNTMLEDE